MAKNYNDVCMALETANDKMHADMRAILGNIKELTKDGTLDIEDILDLPDGCLDLVKNCIAYYKHWEEHEEARDNMMTAIYQRVSEHKD